MTEAREAKMREWRCNIFSGDATRCEKPMFDRKKRTGGDTSATRTCDNKSAVRESTFSQTISYVEERRSGIEQPRCRTPMLDCNRQSTQYNIGSRSPFRRGDYLSTSIDPTAMKPAG